MLSLSNKSMSLKAYQTNAQWLRILQLWKMITATIILFRQSQGKIISKLPSNTRAKITNSDKSLILDHSKFKWGLSY